MTKISHSFSRSLKTIILILALAVGIGSILAVNPFSSRGGESALRFDQWKVLGPGGGGAMFFPTISPHDPKTVLVRCDMTGVYLSSDAGASWRMINLRSPAQFFVFDPVDPRTLYVKTIGLWQSSDSGKSWRLVHPDPSSVKGTIMPDDHASEGIVTEPPADETVTALAVDPSDSKTLFAAVLALSRGEFFLRISKNGGTNWSNAGKLPYGGQKIFVDPRSTRTQRTVYVIGQNRVSILQQGQWTHCDPPEGVQEFHDVSAGFLQQTGNLVVYAVAPFSSRNSQTSGGVVVSSDGGRSWKQANEGFLSLAEPDSKPPVLQAVATCLTQPDTAYLSFNRLHLKGSPNPVSFGVVKTRDRGLTWQPVWQESTASAPNLHDIWISQRFGPGWGENPISLGVAPTNSDICYGTDYGRTLRTTDGGRNWEGVYSRQMPAETFATTGLDVTTCYGIHFDPFNPRRLFISYTDIGLFGSDDGGQSWWSATHGVPRPWMNTTYWIEFDPEVKGRLWGVMSGVHDLPRPKMWRRSSPANYNGGVCLSEDGGRTWQSTNQGMPPTAATHIVVDPRSPAQARTLYVAGFGRGVFKSVDGGTSWVLKNAGIEGREPFAWRLTLTPDGTLYLVVARRSEGENYGNEGDGALYRSRDGAERWEKMKLPEGVNGPNGLAVDPADPQRLYLAAWGRRTAQGAVSGGVLVSGNGGNSWKEVMTKDQHIYDVTIDSKNPRIVYACGFESSVWRSADRGEHWQRIRGYNFKWGASGRTRPCQPGNDLRHYFWRQSLARPSDRGSKGH